MLELLFTSWMKYSIGYFKKNTHLMCVFPVLRKPIFRHSLPPSSAFGTVKCGCLRASFELHCKLLRMINAFWQAWVVIVQTYKPSRAVFLGHFIRITWQVAHVVLQMPLKLQNRRCSITANSSVKKIRHVIGHYYFCHKGHKYKSMIYCQPNRIKKFTCYQLLIKTLIEISHIFFIEWF